MNIAVKYKYITSLNKYLKFNHYHIDIKNQEGRGLEDIATNKNSLSKEQPKAFS